MKRENFGKVCASLRRDLIDWRAGRCYTQKALAELTGIPEKAVGQIERGEKVHLPDTYLLGLADAFKLTADERHRFFAAASGVAREDIAPADQPDEGGRANLIEHARTLLHPVLLHDGLYRIVGLNSAYAAVYGLTPDYLDSISDDDPTKYHIVRHIHDPASPVRRVYQEKIEAVERNNVIYWRYISLIHRHDSLFEQIQTRLLDRYKTFTAVWLTLQKRPFLPPNTYTRNFIANHPLFEALTYTIFSTRLLSRGRELFMTTLLPASDDTQQLFYELVTCADFQFVRGAD